MQSVLALDIDLRRIHAWSSVQGKICYNSPELPDTRGYDVVLAECWSPFFYVKPGKPLSKGELTNRFKAAIYNSMRIGELAAKCPNLLVAPSSTWTQKYPEETRHIMAGCAGKNNHDLRECQAMIFFYTKQPSLWVPYAEYLACV